MAIQEVASVNATAGWLSGYRHRDVEKVDLAEMSAPSAIPKVNPEQVVQDILVSTLQKVRRKASPDVREAAEKYLEAIRAGAL